MKYASIDLETTGIDNERSQILSVGIVIEDTANVLPINELPRIEIGVTRHNIVGEMFALNMNKQLIEDINSYMCAKTPEERTEISLRTGRVYVEESQVAKTILDFFLHHKFFGEDVKENVFECKNHPPLYFTAAGKNFVSFDQKFLERLPRWKQYFSIRNRVLDPAILYVDWKEDDSLPGLSKCKERAGLDNVVTHVAVEDAMDVVMLLRKLYQKDNFDQTGTII